MLSRKFPAAKNYLTILAGTAILAFGLYNIHAQCNITEGGVLGMNLLLYHWFGLSPSISGPVMDLICYAIGFKFLGKAFAKYSIVASLGFALTYALLERFPPLLPSLADLPLLAALLGGCFVGIGVGMAVRVGGAAGGDDALAMTISHVTKLPLARAYLFTDLTVLLLSLTYIPIKRIAFSLVTVTVSSYLIGFVQQFGRKKPAQDETPPDPQAEEPADQTEEAAG